MINLKIHHVGYLVKKLDKASLAFYELGYHAIAEKIFDEYRGVDILFLEKDGYVVELVSPVTETSVVRELIKKYGNSPYHICYETDDIAGTARELTEKHFVQYEEIHEAVALDGRRVVFLIHPQMGMVELVESVKNK